MLLRKKSQIFVIFLLIQQNEQKEKKKSIYNFRVTPELCLVLECQMILSRSGSCQPLLTLSSKEDDRPFLAAW